MRMPRRQGVNVVDGYGAHGLAVNKRLLPLGAIAADGKDPALDSCHIKDHVATDPHMGSVAGQVVCGIGLPASGIDTGGSPGGIVAKPVNALTVWNLTDLRVESAGQGYENEDHPISHACTPLEDCGIRRRRDSNES